MTMRCGAARVVLILLSALRPLAAHHSFAADYDVTRPVTLQGKVTRMEWTNPHARLHIAVDDGSGKILTWELELRAPNVLVRRGWNRNSLTPGASVVIEGYRAKDGSRTAIAEKVTVERGSDSQHFRLERCAVEVAELHVSA